jgi:hypothetical protein
VVDKKYTYWTRAYLEVKLNEKAQLDLEIDNRRYIVPHRQFQTLGRFTVEVRQNSWLSIGTGMAYSLLYSQLSNLTQPEIRPHQEVNINHGSNKWKFNHRLRLEQRFIQDTIRQTNAGINEFNEDTYSFSFRSRYQAAVAYTVINKENSKGHLDLNASSEIMLNARTNELFNTYRQYTGLTYFLGDRSSLELGYLLSFEMNHTYNTMFDYNNIRLTYRQRI